MIEAVNAKSKQIDIEDYIVWFLYLCTIMLAFSGQLATLGSVIIVSGSALLIGRKQIYNLFPLFIFFYSWVVLPGGLAGFRVYGLLLILTYINKRSMTIRKDLIISLVVLLIYFVAVVFRRDMRISIFLIVDLITIVIYLSVNLYEKEDILMFFRYYTFGAVFSGIFGLLSKAGSSSLSYFDYTKETVVIRYSASFIDPNYAGFFFNIAIFIVLGSGLFSKKYLKWGCLLILYGFLLSTISFTSIICNFLGLVIYFTIFLFKIKEFHIDLVKMVALGFAVLLAIMLLRNTSVIESLLYRLSDKMSSLLVGDIREVTTHRASIWKDNYDFFKSQNVYRMLFGGNYLTDFGRDSRFFNVSHQFYIDSFINFGFVGTFILLATFLYRMVGYLQSYTINVEYRSILKTYVMIGFVWLFYSFGLSMFPAWYFLFFFFI